MTALTRGGIRSVTEAEPRAGTATRANATNARAGTGTLALLKER